MAGLRLPDGAGLAQRGGRRGIFITAEQGEVEDVSRLCRAWFPLLPVCRFLCLVCHWCKLNRLQPWSRADKSEAGAQGSEDVPPSPEPALASPSSRGPHSMFFSPLLCHRLSREAVPHALPLYVFLACSLLLRIPWENRHVVPDCAVTAQQRDRRSEHMAFGGWRELLSAVIRSPLHGDPFTKKHSLPRFSRAC